MKSGTGFASRPAMKHALLLSAALLAACSQTDAPTPTAPVQTDAFLDGLKADYPVTLSKLADGVWVHTTNYRLPGQQPIGVNGLVVVDGDAVTLLDGAWGELATVALLERIKTATGKPVTRMIVTHHHADRTAGVDAAERAGVEVFTHPTTPALAARAGWSVPNTSVAALAEPKSRTRVGKVEVAYPGPGHASDNLVVYLPEEKILYGGCMVRGAGVTTLGNTEDADLERWVESLDWTRGTYGEATTVVPGHGKGSTLVLLAATRAMLGEAIGEAGETPSED